MHTGGEDGRWNGWKKPNVREKFIFKGSVLSGKTLSINQKREVPREGGSDKQKKVPSSRDAA